MSLTREHMHACGSSEFLESHRHVECQEQMWPCSSKDRKVTSVFVAYKDLSHSDCQWTPTTPVEEVRSVLL